MGNKRFPTFLKSMIILQCSGQKGGFGFGFPAGRLCWMRTKVSQEWITEKPSMRSAANVSYQLRRFDRVKTQSRLPPQCELFSVQHGVRRGFPVSEACGLDGLAGLVELPVKKIPPKRIFGGVWSQWPLLATAAKKREKTQAAEEGGGGLGDRRRHIGEAGTNANFIQSSDALVTGEGQCIK